jgi:NAD(P) transhydrogenase subunit alpha
MPLTIGVPRETFAGEKRVATVPDVVGKLVKLGFAVQVESGAGADANFDDAAYQAAGATIAPNVAGLMAASDIVFRVRPPTLDEVAQMRPGTTLIGFCGSDHSSCTSTSSGTMRAQSASRSTTSEA